MEEIIAILNGNNGCHSFNAATALANCEHSQHNLILNAILDVYGEGFDRYMTYQEYDHELDGEYEDFCEECESFNSKLIYDTIENVKKNA